MEYGGEVLPQSSINITPTKLLTTAATQRSVRICTRFLPLSHDGLSNVPASRKAEALGQAAGLRLGCIMGDVPIRMDFPTCMVLLVLHQVVEVVEDCSGAECEEQRLFLSGAGP